MHQSADISAEEIEDSVVLAWILGVGVNVVLFSFAFLDEMKSAAFRNALATRSVGIVPKPILYACCF